jgi:hypothetical protein
MRGQDEQQLDVFSYVNPILEGKLRSGLHSLVGADLALRSSWPP